MHPVTTRPNAPVIVGLGEVLWDLLPTGRQLGGAPSNFAYHAGALGADARVISRVGNDDLGRETLERLRHIGLGVDAVETDPTLPTGTVGVSLSQDGQPQFTIHEPVAWDALQGSPAGRAAVATASAVCFGTLGQRNATARATIRSLVAAAPPAALRILDVNLRQHYYSASLIVESLALANVLKVNDGELVRLTELFGLPADERQAVARLAEQSRLRCVVCTRGARGSLLFADGRWSDHPGVSTQVVDTIGAGDSFSAALTLGLLNGWPLETVHQHAARLAAYVCSQAGATPPLPDELAAPFRNG